LSAPDQIFRADPQEPKTGLNLQRHVVCVKSNVSNVTLRMSR